MRPLPILVAGALLGLAACRSNEPEPMTDGPSMRAEPVPAPVADGEPAPVVPRTEPPAATDAGTPGPLLRLHELRGEDDPRTLEKRRPIVDINSTLQIELDKDRLRGRLQKEFGPPGELDVLIARMEALEELSQRGLETLKRALPTDRTLSATEYQAALSTVAGEALPILDTFLAAYPEDHPVSVRINEELLALAQSPSFSASQQYAFVFAMAAEEAGRLRGEVDRVLAEEGLFVQLGAWITGKEGTRPVHLPGFDDYPQGEYVRVERFTLNPSPEQLKELDTLTDTAKQLNEDGISSLADIVDKQVKPALEAYVSDLLACANNVVAKIEGLKTAAANEGEATVAEIDALLGELRRYRDLLQSLADRYGSGAAFDGQSSAELLRRTLSDVGAVVEATRTIKATLGATPQSLVDRVSSAANAVKTAADGVKTEAGTCVALLNEKLAALDQTLDILTGARSRHEVDADALEFGEEVRRLSILDVPDETELDLLYTGARARADAVTLKLAAGRSQGPGQLQDAGALRTLETRQLDLYQVGLYSTIAVGLMFVDPNGTASIDATYQVAPSYSFLLKSDSDDKRWLNELVTPGFGVNVSALDFDRDENPELGVALVLSFFRDYFQVGYGYNVQDDRFFFTFGLRLPLASTTFSNAKQKAETP